MSVKQERHDEAEIQELAAKMVEENKAKMATPQRTPNQPGTSMNILSYLNTNNAKSKSSTSIGNPSNSGDISDESSVRGRFGWISIAKSHIPYIIRGEELYCSVRMVEMKILNRYLTYLHPDIYNCTCIRSYFITEAECRLLNEINIKHCDCQFGREQFTTMDLIVRLTDAEEFFKFLSACYSKLLSGEVTALDRCGFIRINKESVVPYTIYQQQKYVPLFYFEGETDNLKQKADKLEGWDLSYLKFCCKVQGIRNELFAHDSCSVISLNDIKNYFPPGTLFEDYWPKKNMDSQLLISNSNRAPQQIIQWTRQPTHPPIQTKPSPSPKPATQAKAATNSQMHNMHLYSTYGITGGQPAYHPSQPRTASSAVRAYPAAAGARHMRPNYYNSMSQVPPPPLVRASQPKSKASSVSKQDNKEDNLSRNKGFIASILEEGNKIDHTKGEDKPFETGDSSFEICSSVESTSDENECKGSPKSSDSEVKTSDIKFNFKKYNPKVSIRSLCKDTAEASVLLSKDSEPSTSTEPSFEEEKCYSVQYKYKCSTSDAKDKVRSCKNKSKHPLKSILSKEKSFERKRSVTFSDVDEIKYFKSDSSDFEFKDDECMLDFSVMRRGSPEITSKRCLRVDYNKDTPSK
ncbi:uncharacterized protein LOC123321920 isoform X2 [Coccinella septempunctata]|uniref:uncharacterized protein LOC123321920 isoform X2 n=1 Tax=Coccinella septempunctata TaxID=41139 RepID=UPI001D088345|nr:uncharacterized protein LOC123321920 isoform X2 [Coccinella septempunctata]